MSSQAASPYPSPRRLPVRALAVAALLVLGAAGFALSRRGGQHAAAPGPDGPKPAAAAAAPVEVRVEPVTSGSVSAPIRVTGTLRTDETVTLSTTATGVVKRVL